MGKDLEVVRYRDVIGDDEGIMDVNDKKFLKWLDELNGDVILNDSDEIDYVVMKSKGVVVENYNDMRLGKEIWRIWDLDEWKMRMIEK